MKVKFSFLMMLKDISNGSQETNDINVGIRGGDEIIDAHGNILLHCPEIVALNVSNITVML